jgi:hypothetical protein
MRVGDFSVEIVPSFGGVARELPSGQVLSRAGQVYSIRLRNHGPLRCVADVTIDGRSVTAGGLVIEPWSAEELERPIDGHEDGRFTVIAEGDERAFGPDGGRDNPDLGLIEVRFRRELPQGRRDAVRPLPRVPAELPPTLYSPPRLGEPAGPPPRPMAPPDWTPGWELQDRAEPPDILAFDRFTRSFDPERRVPSEADIERAAGTGLTGHSKQRFRTVEVGPLEDEATVIRLRLVIGSEEALAAPQVAAGDDQVPARPVARP